MSLPFNSFVDVNKVYPNGVKAVIDFNLDIYQHEFIVSVGPSGCGKSTTLRMLATRKNNYYIKSLETLSYKSLENGVREVLLLLQERGIRPAIGSSSKNARTILEQIELLHFFEVISDGINLVNPKPDPEVFLKASAALFLKPQDCIVVEDAKAGIDAALAGGFIAVGMGDAYTYEKNTYSIKELKELLLLVRTL